jgi:hypothetical protein
MHLPLHRRPASFVPRVESLEDRRLPAAVTVTPLPGGVLQVRATPRNDSITLFDNGSGAINNVIVVVGKGKVIDPGIAVSTIQVRTFGGNDSVRYVLSGQLLAGVSRTVLVNLGSGQNNFAARLAAGLQTRASLSIEAAAGTGSDTLSLLAGDNVGIAARALLNVAFFGGSDANAINATYLGQLAGTLSLFERGGAGPAQLNTRVTLSQGSTGTGSAQERGGFGDDQLFMDLEKVSLLDSGTITGTVDGGPGYNTCTATAGVTMAHCQQKIEL